MSSTQQVAANQANAQFSTGPRTEEGKKTLVPQRVEIRSHRPHRSAAR
jgi:hypothetical protein